MSFLPLCPTTKDVEQHVDRICNEVAQKAQITQNTVIAEIRQHVESLAEEMRLLKDHLSQLNVELLLLRDIKENVWHVKQQLEKIVSPAIKDGSVDDALSAFFQSAQVLTLAEHAYGDAGQKLSKTVVESLGTIQKVANELQTPKTHPLTSMAHVIDAIDEKDTDMPQILNDFKEAS